MLAHVLNPLLSLQGPPGTGKTGLSVWLHLSHLVVCSDVRDDCVPPSSAESGPGAGVRAQQRGGGSAHGEDSRYRSQGQLLTCSMRFISPPLSRLCVWLPNRVKRCTTIQAS